MTQNKSWPNLDQPGTLYTATGISYLRSQVTVAMVTDGLSNTYMVGEIYLDADSYVNGYDGTDNGTCTLATTTTSTARAFSHRWQTRQATRTTAVFAAPQDNGFDIGEVLPTVRCR